MQEKILYIGGFAFLLASIFCTPLLFRLQSLSLADEAATIRLKLVEQSLGIVYKNSLSGVGLQNFIVAQSYVDGALPYHLSQPVHNIFLYLLAEFGLIIGVFLILLFITLLIAILRSQHKHGYQKKVAIVLLIMIIIIGCFDHYLLTLHQGRILLAFTIATGFAAIRVNSSRKKE